MNTSPPPGEPPSRAGLRDWLSLLGAALGHTDAKVCFTFPLLLTLAAFAAAFDLAPKICAGSAGEYSSLFSTTAQLIVTLLVALAVELRSLRALNARRLIAAGTLSYVTIGAVAAVIALNPTLSPSADRWLFALAMASGFGALLSVLLIAYRGLDSDG